MNFYEKLIEIQATLNAPKNQYNKFGKYAYRNCEDILQALKPHLAKHKLFQKITDELVNIDGRYYVKATVTVTDGEVSESNSAYAREDEVKKGMDGAQITGAASSYSRKYSLNGFWGIDDNKDPDSNEHSMQNNQNGNQPQLKQPVQYLNQKQIADLQALIESKGFTVQQACQTWNIQSLSAIVAADYQNVVNNVNGWG
mgnify:CR=1 FL=1